jgi:hypothetical protein
MGPRAWGDPQDVNGSNCSDLGPATLSELDKDRGPMRLAVLGVESAIARPAPHLPCRLGLEGQDVARYTVPVRPVERSSTDPAYVKDIRDDVAAAQLPMTHRAIA